MALVFLRRLFVLGALVFSTAGLGVGCSSESEPIDDESEEGELRVDEMVTGPGEAQGSLWIDPVPTAFQKGRPGLVRAIVIHDIEGPGSAAINTFRRKGNESSSHYVVDGTGKVFQMVRERDIANHAFHSMLNAYAIGIEHAGYATGKDKRGRPYPYSGELYAASAKLVAELAKRHRIPIDRAHIVAHSQVPQEDAQVTPCGPTEKCGGPGGHSDPGPAWDWSGYMKRVEDAARAIGYSNAQALSDARFPLQWIDPLSQLGLTQSDGSRPALVGGFWATQCEASDSRHQATYRSVVRPKEPARFESRYRQPTVGDCGRLTNGAYPIVISGYTPAEVSGLCIRRGDEVYKVRETFGICGAARPECLTRRSCPAEGTDCVRSAAYKLAAQDVARECRSN